MPLKINNFNSMKKWITYTTLCFLLAGTLHLRMVAQQPVISVFSEGKSLNEVLEEVSAGYNIKFAFDAGSFQHIATNFSLEKITLDNF